MNATINPEDGMATLPWMEVPYSLNSPISSILCIGYSGIFAISSPVSLISTMRNGKLELFNGGMGQESGKQHADRGREWQRENRRSIYE